MNLQLETFLSAFDLKVISHLRRSMLKLPDRRSRTFLRNPNDRYVKKKEFRQFKEKIILYGVSLKFAKMRKFVYFEKNWKLLVSINTANSRYRAILLAVIFDYTTRIDQSVKWNTVQTKVRLCVLHRDQLHFASGTNGWTHKREIQRIDP